MPDNRRRGRARAGAGGQPKGRSWLNTYADMVTLLLAFFVMLFSLSSVDVVKFRTLISAFQSSIGVLPGGRSINPEAAVQDGPLSVRDTFPTQEQIRQMQILYGDVAQFLDDEGLATVVQAEVTERGLVIRFADQVLFDLGKADLKDGAKSILQRVGTVLKESSNPIRVEGHTDDLPIQTARFPSNWELSTARATGVIRFLIDEQGFDPGRLSAAGYGEHYPLVSNDTPERRERNRRVDLVILHEGMPSEAPESIAQGPPGDEA